MKPERKKILIICGPGIGDIVATTPLIKNSAKHFDTYLFNETLSSKVTEGKKILENCPYITGYIHHHRANERENSKKIFFKIRAITGSIIDLFKLLYNVKKAKFYAVIDSYPGTNKTAIFCFLTGIKKRLGFSEVPLSVFYSYKIKYNDFPKPKADNLLLNELGVYSKEQKTQIYLNYQKENIHEIIKEYTIKKNPGPIGINVGRDFDNIRTWQKEKWIKVINELSKKRQVILIGGKDCLQRSKDIAEKTTVINLCGKLNLGQTIKIMTMLSCFITINGGLMHIACAIDIPVIAICGPSKTGWDPYSKKSIIIRGEYPRNCGPCDKPVCKLKNRYMKHACMEKITVKEVIDNTNKLLNTYDS